MDSTYEKNTHSKTCSFFGHRSICDDLDSLAEALSFQIRALIDEGFVAFLFGGYGEFDALCHSIVLKFKVQFPFIKTGFVQAYYKPHQKYDYPNSQYDFFIYPEIEDKPPKFAIAYRNQKILDSSQFCIFYVKWHYGGAFKALTYAKRKKIPFLNIASN